MAKIILDRNGDLHGSTFYRFNVPFNDATDGLPRTPQWIVVPRTPKEDDYTARGQVNWMWMSGLGDSEDRIATKDCPADPNHETHWFYQRVISEAFGGKNVSLFIATSIGDCFALSDELKRRIDALKLRGARIDPIDLTIHVTGEKAKGYWALQFVGKASLRVPKIVGVPNQCPYCGRGKIFCESCGDWQGACPFCKESGLAVLEEVHGGEDDKRVPFEANLWNIIEGRAWDGGDLIQAHGDKFASKRFIDWLLRIHAAPFYAEPVYFCVDGMTDRQWKWFDDLQKPFEA